LFYSRSTHLINRQRKTHPRNKNDYIMNKFRERDSTFQNVIQDREEKNRISVIHVLYSSRSIILKRKGNSCNYPVPVFRWKFSCKMYTSIQNAVPKGGDVANSKGYRCTVKFLHLLTGSRFCASRRLVHRRLRGAYEFCR
jgi:hypothetical protein